MAEAGKAHWRPSSPTPLLKQGNLESAAWDYNQVAFYYLQDERFGQPVPVLSHPQRKCFLMFLRKVSVCAHCLWSCHWVPLETAKLCLCTLLSALCVHWRSSLRLLFLRLKSPALSAFLCWRDIPDPLLFLQPLARLCPTSSCLSCTGSPETDTVLQASQSLRRGERSPV